MQGSFLPVFCGLWRGSFAREYRLNTTLIFLKSLICFIHLFVSFTLMQIAERKLGIYSEKNILQFYTCLLTNLLYSCIMIFKDIFYTCVIGRKAMKLSDNDFEIMNIIWDEGEVTALEISHRLAEKKGWKKPTVYTLIDRLIKKGAVERSEPDYVCRALINKDDVRTSETAGLLERLYNGSAKLLVSGFIKEKQLSSEELEELRKLINDSIDENDRGE